MKQIENVELFNIVQELRQSLIASEKSIQTLLTEVRELKLNNGSLQESSELVKGWIPRSVVMKYLNYGNTQISQFIKKHDIATINIGKRIFISIKSLSDAFEKNLQTN
jgi:hypothetical protein